MKRIVTLLLCGLLLAGCGLLSKQLDEAKGKHIDFLVAKWGLPDGERTILGKKVYFWTSSGTMSFVVPQTQQTTGLVGTTPFYATTTSYSSESVGKECLIQVVVDGNDVVTNYKFRGNLAGCGDFIEVF